MILKIILIFFFYSKFFKKKNKKTFYKKIFFYKKGEYLSRIGNCISCHTLNGGKPFSGGISFKTNFGIINTPNISPSIQGIGNWNFKNFYNSLKLGISKNKKFLYPVFPYLNFLNLKKIDIKCIYFFLKNLKKHKIKNKLNNFKFPFKYRKLLIIWRFFFFKKKIKFFKKYSSIIKRGNYLVNTLGHCNMCHNFNNIIGYNIKNFKFLGNYINLEKWFSYPLNVNNKLNIKKNIKNIIYILKNGYEKNLNIFGPMSEVINNSLQYLSIVDIKSISNFIKKLFNKNKFYIKNYKFLIKKNLKFFYKKGKIIYKNYCKNCHGKFGFGKNFISPSINKNFFNKNFINNVKNILFYNYKSYTFKKNFSYKMPFFTNIKNKNIIYLLNYIFIFNILNKNKFFKI